MTKEEFPEPVSIRDAQGITSALEREVPPHAIQPADPAAGIYGDYIVGQLAIHGANRIFGTFGWRADIISESMIEASDGWVFTVSILISVTDADGNTTNRPGTGVGIAFFPVDRDTGEIADKPTSRQIDTAKKAALTDAVKNALAKFGRALGGELYFDEREAQVLGWEVASKRRQLKQPTVSATPSGDKLADLGATVIKYGVGKDKKFKGMTIAEVYEQDPGYCEWVASLEEPKGFVNQKIAEYVRLMKEAIDSELDAAEATAHEDDVEPEPSSMAAATESPIKYPNQKIGDRWLEDLLGVIADNTGEGRVFGHAKHVTNHLRKYFGVSDVHELTRLQAYALKKYIMTGEKISPPYPPDDQSAEDTTKPILDNVASMMSSDGLESRLPLEDGETPLRWLQRRCAEAGAPDFSAMSKSQLEKVLQIATLIAGGNVDMNDGSHPITKVIEAAISGLAASGGETE